MPSLIHSLPSPQVSYTNSINNRTSTNPTFATKLAEVGSTGAQVLASATTVAAPLLPGASVLSAALNQAAGQLRASTLPADISTLATHPAAGGTQPDLMSSAAQMHQQMVQSNAYMLGLQQQFNQTGVQFTTQSNMLKAKNDAEKNSIANFR